MAISQKVITLHGPFRELERTTSRGKKKRRTNIIVQATPIVHDFDSVRLGDKPAKAITEHLRIQGKRESAKRQVSASTERTRESHIRGFNQGKRWAKKRYGGGRTGDTPPSSSRIRRLGYFSGRLVNGLFTRENPTLKEWTTNVPANRLNRDTSRTEAEFRKMLDGVLDIFPSLRNPSLILKDPDVKAAVRESIRDFIFVGTQEQLRRRAQLSAAGRRALLDIARGLGGRALLRGLTT